MVKYLMLTLMLATMIGVTSLVAILHGFYGLVFLAWLGATVACSYFDGYHPGVGDLSRYGQIDTDED